MTSEATHILVDFRLRYWFISLHLRLPQSALPIYVHTYKCQQLLSLKLSKRHSKGEKEQNRGRRQPKVLKATLKSGVTCWLQEQADEKFYKFSQIHTHTQPQTLYVRHIRRDINVQVEQ